MLLIVRQEEAAHVEAGRSGHVTKAEGIGGVRQLMLIVVRWRMHGSRQMI